MKMLQILPTICKPANGLKDGTHTTRVQSSLSLSFHSNFVIYQLYFRVSALIATGTDGVPF